MVYTCSHGEEIYECVSRHLSDKMASSSPLVRLALAVALVMVTCSKMAEGCSCAVSHPQQHACSADFVIVARVKRFSERHHAYKVKIKREFKMSEKASLALKAGRLVSLPSSCAIHLSLEKTYLIAGRVVAGRASISLCSYVKPWEEVTIKQRKGFRLLYSKACNCQVVDCPWYRECRKDSPSVCNWETSRNSDVTLPDCQAQNSVCMKMASGGCGWTQDRQYRECMKMRRTIREDQLAREP